MFAFGDESRYQALKVGDQQYEAVESYEAQRGIPVYYMLYHPPRIPFATEIPRVVAFPIPHELDIGTRVIPGTDLRAALASKPAGYSPYYKDVKSLCTKPEAPTTAPPGWLIEEFIADLALDCKVGYLAKKESDESLRQIFHRRSGPIAAAIAVTFDAPSVPGN